MCTCYRVIQYSTGATTVPAANKGIGQDMCITMYGARCRAALEQERRHTCKGRGGLAAANKGPRAGYTWGLCKKGSRRVCSGGAGRVRQHTLAAVAGVVHGGNKSSVCIWGKKGYKKGRAVIKR